MSLLSIAIGLLLVVINYFLNTETVQQQTVQYLGYVCGSVFIVGGFICLQMTLHRNKIMSILNVKADNLKEILTLLKDQQLTYKSMNNSFAPQQENRKIADPQAVDELKCLFEKCEDNQEKKKIAEKLVRSGYLYYQRYL